jgi:hypothetical protein
MLARSPAPLPSDDAPVMITITRGDTELTAELADNPRHAVIVAARLILGLDELRVGDQVLMSRL